MILNKYVYDVYVDGACLNNGKSNAKSGIGIYFGKNDIRNVSASLKYGKQTNNRAELMAILVALKIIYVTEKENNIEYNIYTDSKYSIECVTCWIYKWKNNNWKTANNKPVQNQELIEKIYDMLIKLSKVKFFHIKGHSNGLDKHSIGNKKADTLAVRSVR
jgi:ribonuclease HI